MDDQQKTRSQLLAELAHLREKVTQLERAETERKQAEARKEAEDALKESKEKYRQLVEALNEGIWSIDAQGYTTFANPKMAEMLGYTVQEMLGKHLFDFMEKEWVQEAQAKMNMRQQGVIEQHEFVFQTKDGERVYTLLNASPISDAGGDYAGALAGVTDITERVQAQSQKEAALEALRESEEKFRCFVEQSHDGVFLTDERGVIVEWNPALERILGITRAQALGQFAWDVQFQAVVEEKKNQQMYARIQAQFETFLETKEAPWLNRLQSVNAQHSDGSLRAIEQVIFPIQTGARTILGAIFRDVSERVRAEEDIRRALAEKTALIQELYHRTKNNMQVICALLDFQTDYIDDERALQALTETQNRIYSMALVHQMLYAAQDLSHINLRFYIRDLAAQLTQRYYTGRGKISWSFDMQDVFVLVDTAMPCALLLNELFSNALRHAFPGARRGEISVRLARAVDGVITLEVKDDGVGFPPGFDPRRDGKLGLKNVVSLGEGQMRGQIHFDGQDGVMCRLRFRDDWYEKRV